MTRHHRCEVLDDNMFDSNWKKWIGIGMVLFMIQSCKFLTRDVSQQWHH